MRIASVLIAFALVACNGSSSPTDATAHPDSTTGDATNGDGAADPFASLAVTETDPIAGLDGPVNVIVDHYGWPHIYATTLHDLAFVQGVLSARDRMAEMDLLRRTAEGTLAEAFGAVQPDLIDQDLAIRVIGLARAATATWAAIPDGRAKTMLEAYAAGVNQYLGEIRAFTRVTPPGTDLVINDNTPDWTPIDSLAVGRLEALTQSYAADDEITASQYRQAATTTFDESTDPLHLARAGFFWDFYRFAPPASTTVVGDFFSSSGMGDTYRPNTLAPRVAASTTEGARHFFDLLERACAIFGGIHSGSNNYAVGGSVSANGHAMLESDPHMDLPSPSIWWGVHLTVTQGADAAEVAGVALPGAPGVVIGFNRNLSWGLTNAFYDQVDEYVETVTPGTGSAPPTVLFNGAQVPMQTIVEPVNNGLGGTVMANIQVVPQHGPIAATISGGMIQPVTGTSAMSIRWVGAQPTNELQTLADLMYATDVTSGRAALANWQVPAMNFVFADSAGNVAFSSQSNVPIRAPGARTWDPTTNIGGTLPCSVLPGTGEAEWTGSVDPSMIPNALGSTTHPFFVTANNDQAGVSIGNDPLTSPVYLGCKWALGFRAERITDRLGALVPHVAPTDMLAIQSDHLELLAGRLIPFIDSAFMSLQAEWTTPGSHPDLTALAVALQPRMAQLADAHARLLAWSTNCESGIESGASTPVIQDSIASTIFHAWLVRALDATFSDELAAMNVQLGGFVTDAIRETSVIFLAEHPTEALTGDAIWDDMTTTQIETRDFIFARSLDEALTQFATTAGTTDVTTWQWGRFHTVTFSSIIPGPGSVLSIPPSDDPMFPNGFPHWGGIETVDVGEPDTADFNFTYSEGPSQRYTVEMDPTGPRAINALPGGESEDINSPHHRDEAELWRTNAPHPVPFNMADVVAAYESRILFRPM